MACPPETLSTRLRLITFGEVKGGAYLIMVYVKKGPGESPDAIIRKFSRKVMSEGIMQEMKKREFYLKTSLAKKFKKELSRKFAAKQFNNS